MKVTITVNNPNLKVSVTCDEFNKAAKELITLFKSGNKSSISLSRDSEFLYRGSVYVDNTEKSAEVDKMLDNIKQTFYEQFGYPVSVCPTGTSEGICYEFYEIRTESIAVTSCEQGIETLLNWFDL